MAAQFITIAVYIVYILKENFVKANCLAIHKTLPLRLELTQYSKIRQSCSGILNIVSRYLGYSEIW